MIVEVRKCTRIYGLCCLALLLMATSIITVPALASSIIRVEDLDISQVIQAQGSAQRDKSVSGNSIIIGGQTYTHGLGTHAESLFQIYLGGNASQFTSAVGVDSEVGTNGTVEFVVITDETIAWRSGIMHGGDVAKTLTVNLTGVQKMRLVVTTANDGLDNDHADWADPQITVTGNPSAIVPYQDPPVILTPAPPTTPRINGARVFGVRPNSPFLFTIPATGNRPMTFTATGLPSGLSLNSSNGQITGTLTQAGTFNVTLTATNGLGQDTKNLQIICGTALALTPPMGWNSYNYLNANATEQIMRSVADAFVSKDLINHGWTYINTDFGWNSGANINPVTHALQPDPAKYQNFKGMCDYIHSLGLKVGLYSTPWEVGYSGFIGESADNANRTGFTLGGNVGPYTFETVDVTQWVTWGVDFMKYDWCPIDITSTDRMSTALRAAPRDIVYSLSNAATFSLASQYATLSNCWRTTGDINDNWYSISSNGFSQDQWRPYAGPGHWNDPDMLEIGHPRLTPNEQYTHMSLWCMLCSPLLMGFDVTQADAFTLNLLNNDEVIEVNQDPLGQQAARLVYGGDIEMWAKDMSDGSKAVGLFNRGFVNETGTLNWTDLGITGGWRVRDLWAQQDVGTYTSSVSFTIPWHGCVLVRVFPTSQSTHTITASAGANGAIAPSGNVMVYHGTNQTFNITPNSGYKITGVTVDGTNVGAVTTYTFTNVTANHSISAAFADASTWGITASAGTGGSISPSGEVRVQQGSNQTFAITASQEYAISNVTVDGLGQGAITSYTFTNVQADHTISAAFVGTTTRYEAEATANTLVGGCTIRSDGTWWTGTGFVGNLGNSVSNVLTFNGVTVPSTGNYTVTMRYMTWGTRQTHMSVNGVGDYVLDCPEGSGTNVNTASISLPLTAGSNAIAMWNPTAWAPDIDYISLPKQGYTITASSGANGSINPSGAVLVAAGANQTFTITPNAGYAVSQVTVDSVNQGAITSYTFTNVQANHTISTTFVAVPTYTITASAGTGGTITPSGAVVVNQGSNKTFTIAANSGYAISQVTVDSVNQGAITSYTFTNVQANHTISATFVVSTSTTYEAEAAANTLTGTCVRRTDGTWWTGTGFVGSIGYGVGNALTFNGVTVPSAGNYTITMRYMTWGTRQTHMSVNGVGDYVLDCPEGSGTNVNTASISLPLTAGSNAIAMWNPTAWAPDIDNISIPAVTYTITASSGANGSIAPTGAVVVNYGANQTFNMTANSGYRVSRVLVDGANVGAVTSYTFNNVTANHTISVEYISTDFVAYWKFDETSGTSAYDWSGNGKAGTLNGSCTWVAGLTGNAVNIPGGTSYVGVPNGIVYGLTNFTVAAWVKLTSRSANMRIFDFGTSTTNYMEMTPQHATSSGKIQFVIRTSSTTKTVTGTAALPTGSWQHVAVTLSGQTLTLYVQGAQVGQITNCTITPNSLGSTTKNYIGKSQTTSHPYLNGAVNGFRIYNRALTGTEITTLYGGGAGPASVGGDDNDWIIIPAR